MRVQVCVALSGYQFGPLARERDSPVQRDTHHDKARQVQPEDAKETHEAAHEVCGTPLHRPGPRNLERHQEKRHH